MIRKIAFVLFSLVSCGYLIVTAYSEHIGPILASEALELHAVFEETLALQATDK